MNDHDIPDTSDRATAAVCLDNRYSTTRRLFQNSQPPASPPGLAAKVQGGLRFRGYAKKNLPGLPLVTVVTVVLNEAQALAHTIESVLDQTYENIEFIVIDGGSTDSTLDLLPRYDDRIDHWLSGSDRGIYDAMNKGIALASGEWINFLNAGDLFYESGTVAAVFGKVVADDGATDFIFGHTCFLGGDFRGVVKAWKFDILWKTMVFTHQSLFTRARLLKGRPFDTRFQICADYNLIFNSYMEGKKFFHSDTVIAAFDPGLSDVNRARMALEKWRVVRRFRNDWKFHWFYLRLFCKRLFRDAGKRWSRRRARGGKRP